MNYRLKDRRKSPPNGILYEQRQTGWRNWLIDPSSVWDFYLTCRLLQEHRKANPRFGLPTDMAKIEAEVDHANAQRVAAIPGAADEFLIAVNESVGVPPSSLGLSGKLAAAVQALKRVNAGRTMLLDWEKAGYPQAPQEQAEARAERCVDCKKNGQGDFTTWFTEPAAEHIKNQIERLKEINLSTLKDDLLGTCSVCLCPLRLKMHPPTEFVLKYLDDTIKAELSEVRTQSGKNCWVIDELNENSAAS